jgi:hypothetical protein
MKTETAGASPAPMVLLSCLALFACAPAFSAAAKPPTLCLPDEQVLFSCVVNYKSRIVSLCASKSLAATTGYLQYRFGKAVDNVEMEYPDPRDNSLKMLHYGHYFRAQVDRIRVYFNTEKYLYELFTDYEGDATPKIWSKGVRSTETTSSKDHTFECIGPALSDLSKLETVLSCNPDESDCPSAK